MASVTAPSAGTPAEDSPSRNYARVIEQTWIWSIVGYSVLRFVVAWGAFSEHGANVWVFGIIDVGTAWPYAKSVAEVCKRAAHSDWKGLPLPLVVAIATFFAPYAYLWFAAGEMPAGVRLGMVLCVSVLLVAATLGVLSKTRKMRAEAAAEAESAPATAVARAVLAPLSDGDDAVLVDLSDGARRISRAPGDPVSGDDLVIDLTDADTHAVLERRIANG